MREQKPYTMSFKCEFLLDSVACLGHVVSDDSIKVDSKKIEVVQNMLRPTTEIWSFLSFRVFVDVWSKTLLQVVAGAPHLL